MRGLIILAQLIKLKDYVSRYEWNVYRYSGQFIRLKQEKWQKLYDLWLEEREKLEYLASKDLAVEQDSLFQKIKSFFKKDDIDTEDVTEGKIKLPTTEQDLRQYFLNHLYPFQLKWATSTVTDVSFMDESFNHDPTLIYFLQRFPDIYLLLYEPVFNIKNAPVDGDVIMISPIGIEVIYLLEDHPSILYMASEERTWTAEKNHAHEQILSPMITLRRTERIVASILNKEGVSLPITKTVLSRTNDIIFSSEPYKTNIIGQQQYEKWFKQKRRLSSPLKNDQLRAAQALLKYCISQSVKRPEWEIDEQVMNEEL